MPFNQGFITMAQFRGIIAEVRFHSNAIVLIFLAFLIFSLKVDPNLSEEDLDGIIAEIDEDGSGTMDFDEFCEMMMTSPEDSGE